MTAEQSRRFDHLRSLIDDTGIWQHTIGTSPDATHGYCLDDAARAAIVTHQLALHDPRWTPALRVCCRFITVATLDTVDGAHNLMNAEGIWLDDPHPGDHVGRTVWALGELAASFDPVMRAWAVTRLDDLIDGDLLDRSGLHGRTYALLGLTASPAVAVDHEPLIRRLVGELLERIDPASLWLWPETRIRYDAGRFPEALIRTGVTLGSPAIVETGLDVLAWLTTLVAPGDDAHRYPGHHGLGLGDDLDDSGDEQPLEAAAFAAAHVCAHHATDNPDHLDTAHGALAWFHGANRLHAALADPVTGACRDGLGRTAPNNNQGAESTLAYAATALLLDSATSQAPSQSER